MKKLFYIAALVLLIAACGKDEVNPIDNNLIGTWQLEYYYRDDDNNPINIDKAESYQKYNSPYHSVVFNADTACGFNQHYIDEYISESYFVKGNKIFTNKICEYYQCSICSDYYIDLDIQYKIKNNQLIIASNSYSNTTQNLCVFYGFYKRIANQ
jgi:predicted RNA-binding protein with PIN domain